MGKGDSYYDGKAGECSDPNIKKYSASIKNIIIYNNIIDNVGWDGLQLKDGDDNVKVYNNKITHYGLTNNTAQNEGLYLGAGTVGEVYHILIINGTGNGFQYFGLGNLNFHNNIIANVNTMANPGDYAMWLNGKYSEINAPNSYIRILNNTIVKTTRVGVHFQNYETITNRLFINNILAGVPSAFSTITGSPTFTQNSNNRFNRNPNDLQFVRYLENSENDFLTNDFHLAANSPAVDNGANTGIYSADSIAFDFDGCPRGFNSVYDIGAYEYSNNCPGNGPGHETSWSLFINSGGDNFVQGNNTWEKDKQTEPHQYLNTSFPSLTTGGTASFSGSNTTDAPNQVLGSYRYTSGSGHTINYNIPVPVSGANYDSQLFFARKNTDTYTSGVRRFNIVIEGQTVTTYDVYDNAGTGAASFGYATTVNDGMLNLSFVAVSGSHAQVNAISIVKQAGHGTNPNPPIFLTINSGGDNYSDDDMTWEKDKQTEPHRFLNGSTLA